MRTTTQYTLGGYIREPSGYADKDRGYFQIDREGGVQPSQRGYKESEEDNQYGDLERH